MNMWRKKVKKDRSHDAVRYDVVFHNTIRGDMTYYCYTPGDAKIIHDYLAQRYPNYNVETIAVQ